jgi:hypothetical protein
VLIQSCFEGFQAFEKGEHRKTHTHGCLVPIVNGYTKSLWQGRGIKIIAHGAVSSCP